MIAVVPFVVATLAGLAVLWPGSTKATATDVVGPPPDLSDAVVVAIRPGSCGAGVGNEAAGCLDVVVRLESGPEKGGKSTIVYSGGPGTAKLKAGDPIVVGRTVDPDGTVAYYFADFQRRTPLLLLGALFVAAVVVLGRRRGAAALVSLLISLAILVKFVLPAILDGKNPLAVAIVGSAAVMFVALYLTHGVNARTTTAVLGTLASLLLIAILAAVFVAVGRFTGLASEEAGFLQVAAGNVNLHGLLLGGIIIGSLGVLDDVTVTQASAVWQLHDANPDASARRLYHSALEIGRDHIASTVNTLVLAYAGASLPLLVLFAVAGQRFGGVITSEVVAEEVVRTLVGSVGLVASVPVTTALSALVVTQQRGRHQP
ncbi:MAG: hypothetical protein QOF60_2175 [Actinomycetota bacterium]|jgi:uncharacterized membrane protein|nr:hypothetical protein [Actinomycetota bacterium]